jgi:hypothetical protein
LSYHYWEKKCDFCDALEVELKLIILVNVMESQEKMGRNGKKCEEIFLQ